MKNSYKTLTAKIETPTLLDDFAPTYIHEIEERFKPIKQLKEELCDKLNYHSEQLKTCKIFDTLSENLNKSSQHLDEVFKDFESRMKYFTLVFFGAVSAGKTSMICDLATMNPKKLTEIISNHPNFDPKADGISIGPNVATINLYEILIEKSCIRLVDVPGIGGVVHENDTLAPFVDMADCIIFLLDANSDITKNDYDFLYDNVAAIDRVTVKSQEKNGFITEKGLDKKVMVVINKWKSAYQGRPPAHAEKDWERKNNWILNGDKDKGFSGIAGLFSKDPEVVRANTSFRDEETGEPYPGVEEVIDMEEVVNTLRNILGDEGASLRLKRPRQIIGRELNQLSQILFNQKAEASIDILTEDLENLGVKLQGTSGQMLVQLQSRLDNLENIISTYISPQLKRAIQNWKPKVGFMNTVKGLVPDWVPGAERFGATAMREDLKEKWKIEMRDLIKNNVNFGGIESILRQEAQTMATLVASGFQVDISGANPKLVKRLSGLKSNVGTSSINQDSAITALEQEINGAVSNVDLNIIDDLLLILGTDLLLDVLLHAILTPVGGAILSVLWRKWRGDQQNQQIKQQIDSAIDQSVKDAALDIKLKLSEKLQQGIKDTEKAIRQVLEEEKEEVVKPIQIIDEAIKEIEEFKIKLNSLAF